MILYPDLSLYFVSGFLFWSEEPWWLLGAQHSWSSTSVMWHHDSELVLKTVIVLSFFPVAKGLPGHPVDSAENESALCGSRNDRPYALAHRGWCHEGNPAVKPLLQQSLSKGESETVSSQTLNISTRWHIQIKITALLSLFNCTFDHSINLWMWPCVYLYIDPKSLTSPLNARSLCCRHFQNDTWANWSWDQRLGFWISLAAIQLVFRLIYS